MKVVDLVFLTNFAHPLTTTSVSMYVSKSAAKTRFNTMLVAPAGGTGSASQATGVCETIQRILVIIRLTGAPELLQKAGPGTAGDAAGSQPGRALGG